MISAAAAIVIAATIVLLTIYGVERLFSIIHALPIIHAHRPHRWFTPVFFSLISLFNLVFVFCLVIPVALKEQRAKSAREETLTPLVRRSPTTGMREF
jgi:hypothetical protein